jgi:hypothetical protein
MQAEIVSAQGTRRRPFGVKVVIVLQIISIFGLLLALIALWVGPEVQLDIWTNYGPGLEVPVSVVGVTVVVLQLVILFGMIRLRRWAWYLVIVLAGVSLAVNLWRYFAGLPDYLSMVTNVLTVLYLNQREVQQAFEQSPDHEAPR